MKILYNYVAALLLCFFTLGVSHAQIIFQEDFSTGAGQVPPAGWSNDDFAGNGGLWYFDNPGGQTLNAPITDPAAVFDSDFNGNIGGEDAVLVSPTFDASAITGTIMLSFDHYFEEGFGGAYDVEVFDGATWNSVLAGTTSTADPQAEDIDITLAANGSAIAQVRFHWTGDYSWYWIVDNVTVYTVPDSPLLSQDPGIPTCATGTNITAAGSPDPGVEWYWQASAVGTSTADPYVGPLTVFNNGTYYIRAYVPALDVWADAEAITISNFPVATDPPAPVAAQSPVCLPGTTISVDPAPAGYEYYWQGTTVDGTSMAADAATPYNVGSTGTYYVSAYETATQCWSSTVGVTVTVQTEIPDAPIVTTAVYDICSGLSDFDIEATPGSSTIILNQSTSLGTSITHSGTGLTIPVAIPALPAGATITSAELLLTDVEAINGSWRSEIRIALGDMFTLAPTQISALGSPGVISPDPVINLAGFPTTGGSLDLIITESFDDGGVDDATFGEVVLSINYSLPADVSWFDAATAGTQVGTGTPFDCIGNSVLTDPSTLGTYEFYAATIDGVCESATRALVTVNVIDVNAALIPVDETCVGYNNGSFTLGTIECGTEPFLYSIGGGAFGPIPTDLGPGTYSVVIQDATMLESNPIMITIGTIDTVIPEAPLANPDVYDACASDLSIPINAQASPMELTYTLDMFDSYGDGWNGASVDILANGTLVANGTFATGTAASINFNVFEGDVITTEWNTGAFDGECTFDILDENAVVVGSGDATGMITYNVPFAAYTMNWYDAATAGTFEGTGSPFETVGTTVIPTTTPGVYEFYAETALGNCLSASRTLVTVNVNNVNVELDPIDADCNNSPTGSFIISALHCGAAPFQFSVDGGAFGAIPTDLMAGTYSVVVQDGNLDQSSTYVVIVGEAGAPSDAYMEVITDNGGQVSWNSNGSETEWNVEWGLPGFTPGTGTEIGSDLVTDTFAIITGLDGNTEYDVYVSANCGAGTTTGSWNMVNFTTACGIYGIPFIETFEDNSETRACWQNIQEVGAEDWTYQTGSSGGLVTTAYEGTLNARFVSAFGTGDPITKLESPRFDFAGQDSVAVIFAYAQEFWSPDQNITKVYTSGAASVWTEIASYTGNVSAWTLDTLYLTDTTVQIAFEGINNFGRANVIDYVQVLPCTLNEGIDGTTDVCRLDGTIDLTSIVTLGEDFGTWSFPSNPGVLNGSVVNVSTLPSGDYDFYYIVKTPCAEDTTIATLTIYPPSSAGSDGTITACLNEPINLLSGLSGNIDLGGQWYDPSNNPTSVSITASNFGGNYNYDYITTNGVCPNDTSNIVLTVLSTCNYLDIQELVFGEMNVYPNPTDGLVFVSSTGNAEVFSYELTDVNGRVISVKEAAINGTETTEISFEKLEPGIYMIRVYNDSAEKTFRVVKQ